MKKTFILVTALCVYGIIGFFVWNNQDVVNSYTEKVFDYLTGSQEALPDFAYDDLLVESIRTNNSSVRGLQTKNNILEKTLAQLQQEKNRNIEDIRIMIVTGHTRRNPGAAFKSLSEYQINLELTTMLEGRLSEQGYQIITTHAGDGYNEQFTNYFTQEKEFILQFRKEKRETFEQQYPQGVVTNDTDHTFATPDGILALYGINKWANENQIDLVLHVHFNDSPGRKKDAPGPHSGFAVFVPLKTNDNFTESFRFGKLLERSLVKDFSRSTLRKESAGVLETELIAAGSFNSVSVPSVLLEGGYIYEADFHDTAKRAARLLAMSQRINDAVDTFFGI